MIASSIFLIILVGTVVSVQVYGLKVYAFTAAKVKATTSGTETLNNIRDRVRAAKQVYVGTYTNNVFTTIPNGTSQTGNALQVLSTTNVANASVFYLDPDTSSMNFVDNGTTTITGQNITNYYCFQAEDFQGNVLTNYLNNPVMTITLMYKQQATPSACEYYRLHTRITMRTKN